MTMRRRARGFRRGVRRARRAVEWFDSLINETVTTSQQTDDLSANIPSDEKKGMTIIRLLIDLVCAAAATGTGNVIAMGIAMVENDAVAAAAFPDPGAETDQPGWLWREVFSVYTSTLNDRAQSVPIVRDIRARRRFPARQTSLYLIIDTVSGSTSINIDGSIRVLVAKS